jgi:hypothetical protein
MKIRTIIAATCAALAFSMAGHPTFSSQRVGYRYAVTITSG